MQAGPALLLEVELLPEPARGVLVDLALGVHPRQRGALGLERLALHDARGGQRGLLLVLLDLLAEVASAQLVALARVAERLLRDVVLISWAGMRGVVSLAAALALPIDFPERNLVIFLTFAVILATLVGQGLTLPFLVRRLGIEDGGGSAGAEEAYARLITADAATGRLDQLAAEWPGHLELIDNLRAQYDHRTRHERQRKHPEERDDAAEQELIEHRQIRMSVLMAEREALFTLRERGAISDDVHRTLERDLDLEELRMEV